jgi:hypothetical protein
MVQYYKGKWGILDVATINHKIIINFLDGIILSRYKMPCLLYNKILKGDNSYPGVTDS